MSSRSDYPDNQRDALSPDIYPRLALVLAIVTLRIKYITYRVDM